MGLSENPWQERMSVAITFIIMAVGTSEQFMVILNFLLETHL